MKYVNCEVKRMKIEKGALLEQAVQAEQPFGKAKVTTSFSETARAKMDALDKSVPVRQTGYDKEEVSRKSAVEEFEQKISGQMSAADRKDQMAVLANTMTPEDYRRAQEEGFCVRSTSTETVVTVTDKIKAQLAKAGVDLSGIGDSLTKEQLEEIGGSLAAVRQLEQAFQEADLPLTEENMTDGLKAYRQAGELAPLSKGAIKYMLDNHLRPTVENLYFAEFSASSAEFPSEGVDIEALKGQMEQIILAAGESVNEQTLADGAWMVESGVALTPENFSYMQKLMGLTFPIEEEILASEIAMAVAEGERPKDAMLLPEYTLTAQAERAVEVVTQATDEDIAYILSNEMELTIESLEQAAKLREQGKLAVSKDGVTAGKTGSKGGEAVSSEGIAFLTAKRMLEETRLAMTTEANRALLKQGITIDTKPLEELVEKLKEQESNYYAALLSEGGEVADASMAALFEETTQKVSDLKQMPAYLLGMRGRSLDTVNGLHEAGSALQKEMEKAGESYEALMTAPRKDLGDSIQKAFANVDDILTDLGMERSEANERAVRILAYNSLDITEEAILTMKAADERVQRAFSNLTPGTVRELIRQGCNPLDMDLDALNRRAEEIRREINDSDTERFSEYLWKLEQSHGITPEERESFIGVYRLMNQIEKTDGAAIGALISQGADLTMRNLLTAVRSAKKSGMDYTVDDAFAGVDRGDSESKSITEQIETAYQSGCMRDAMETLTPVTMQKLLNSPDWEDYTPEQLKQALLEFAAQENAQEEALEDAYAKSQMEEFKQAAVADDEVYQMLSRFELPNTVSNILAANRLLHRPNKVFSQMFNSEEAFSGERVDFEAIKKGILEQFGEAVKTPKEMAAAQETLAETAENVMKTMIQEEESVTSVDVRELKLMRAQMSIAGKMAENEEYSIPVMVGGEVTNISLKIVRGEKKKGMVEIMFETAKAGKVAASIEAKENGISGFAAVDDMKMKELMESHIGQLSEGFGEEAVDFQVTYVKSLNLSRFSHNLKKNGGNGAVDGEQQEVQTARLYKIAKGFLEGVKKLEL